MKDSPRQSFRFAAHTIGAAAVKPRDYEAGESVDAPSPYAAWRRMIETGEPLQVGDLLEQPDGALYIYKYVGFEEAHWVLPEIKSGLEMVPPAAGIPEAGNRVS